MDAPGFKLPISPFRLVQESPEVRVDPWRVLVASVLTFQTDSDHVPIVLGRVLQRWPTDDRLAGASLNELIPVVQVLGMQRRRARFLIGLSLGYLMGWHTSSGCTVADLEGVGSYGADAWALFVEGRTSVYPRDRKLKKWLEWRIEECGR